jgi:YVTN family beta-propeller protein
MVRLRRLTAAAALLAMLLGGLIPSVQAVEDGSGRLPSGWGLTPAGRLLLDRTGEPGLAGPGAVALSPNGRWALVPSSGTATQNETAEVFDLQQGKRASVQVYDGTQGASVFYGVAFSPDGRHAWASGGGQGVLHAYDVKSTGQLVAAGDITAGFFPAGLAYGHTPLGDRIYVANNLGGVTTPGSTYEDPPGHTVTVIDPARGAATATIDLGAALDPLAVTFSRNGKKAFVTNWAGRSVSVIDTATQRTIGQVGLSPQSAPLLADHPTGIAANPTRDEVYVANANSDTVSVIDAAHDRLVATIDVALVAGSPKGSMAVGLTVSPDGRLLFVADAGENAIAVVDLEDRSVLGFIPTAWYPSDVKITPDGKRLVVVNTYGFGAGPNPCGPFTPLPPAQCPNTLPDYSPGTYYTPPLPETQYSGTMIKGSVEIIDLPDGEDGLSRHLAAWTAQVRRNNHANLARWPVPAPLQAITHVIYVIKENRTYDQVFGDLGRGNGEPALTLFTDASAPNHRALARRFVLLDNFHADALVSQDGHPWSVQGVATDYVNKVWPFDYAAAYYRSYDSEFVPVAQQFASEPLASDPTVSRPAAAATAGYLWDNAYAHGVSFRDYGEGTPFNDPTNCSSGQVYSDLTHLQARFGNHVDSRYPGWNLDCSDHAVREREWEREFNQFVRTGNLPRLQIVYLPNDHTQGTTPGTATPASYMADNDLALGRLVAAVSHSRYWRSTAIFVVEDDAQDGPDHVDAHRTAALVISPYTQHARVDSTHYDTAAMLATMERLLGLPPMSIFDQRAMPMWASFGSRPNLRAYDAITPSVIPFGDPGYPTNTASSPLAGQSAAQNFSVPDGPDKQVLNQAIWESIRGSAPSSRSAP